MYDTEDDLLESLGLADDPDYVEVPAMHKGKIREFQRTTQDPWLLKWSFE